jgi:hypothetical protein
MPSINISDINVWAVLVAAAATVFLGGAWYAGLFARTWQRLHGYSDEKVKQMQAARPPAMFFGVMFAAYVVLAAVMSLILSVVGVNSAIGGAGTAAMLWVVPASIAVTAWLAYDKPLACYVLDGAFQLVFFIVMGSILGAWR